MRIRYVLVQMHRHGSRYPLASELVFVTNLVAKLGNSSEAIQKARLPENLQFLKNGYTSTLGHDDLHQPPHLNQQDGRFSLAMSALDGTAWSAASVGLCRNVLRAGLCPTSPGLIVFWAPRS